MQQKNEFDTMVWSRWEKLSHVNPHRVNFRSPVPNNPLKRKNGYKYKESYPMLKYLLTVEPTDLYRKLSSNPQLDLIL